MTFKFDGGVRRIYFLQPTMTVLITGGTGQTGLILCRLLNKANISLLSCSRSGTAPRPYKAVKFDWFNEKTFKNPFRADPKIDRVYLIVPSVMGQLSTVKSFIDVAISKGVKRFVLLTGSRIEIGSPVLMGKVHEYLFNIKVGYTVLRPTWFIRTNFSCELQRQMLTTFTENFGTTFYQSIREQNEFYSVAEDGRFPFVSTEDIAQAAFDALVSKQSPNKDYYVVGPELFSNDQVSKSSSKSSTNVCVLIVMYRWLNFCPRY